MFALLCFAFAIILLWIVFVVENGHMRCGVRDVQETCNDETVPFKCLRQPSSVAWGDCWPVRETPRRGGLSSVIGANLGDNMWQRQVYTHLYIYIFLYEHKRPEFGRFVCLCLCLFVIDLAGPIPAHSRSCCGPESSRATTALGRGQLT